MQKIPQINTSDYVTPSLVSSAITGRVMLSFIRAINTKKLKKLLPAMPFLLPIGLPDGAIQAAQVGSPFSVTVSTVVGTACSLSGQVASLGIASITDALGKLNSGNDLAATKIATISCNAGATIQLAATNGFYKSSTQSTGCTTESPTCISYDAKLSLNGTFTPIVNAVVKTQSVTIPSSANGDIKLEMDIVGAAGAVLPASTYSEIFTVTVSTP
jgi:hypothetical protein